MNMLEVKDLCKKYPSFELKNVSFNIEPGKITGFIGRNGAGKSTTLNSLFNFVHPDKGEIFFFGKPFYQLYEKDIKQSVGFVSSGINYYPKKKIKTITDVTRRFYNKWDEEAYGRYIKMFDLDEEKTPEQLSAGMRVKYALALCLSHNAELLVLDEPTSGLDPVSRDDLLDVFMDLCDEGKSILFSTHITSDLDKCADNIIYIKNGSILAESDLESFIDCYRLARFEKGSVSDEQKKLFISVKRSKKGYTALIKKEYQEKLMLDCEIPSLEDVMIHLEKEGE